MQFLLPHLAIGSFEDVATLAGSQVTRIVTVCEARPETPLIILHRPIPDEMWLPPRVWQGLVEDIHALRMHGHTIFVHCRLGISRAPTAVAAYLIFCGYAPQEALALIQAQRPMVRPHPETWRGMLEWSEGKRQASNTPP
jgi:protein-tyrosine phosphatase